ncbi:hypothetical protein T492DRAFT_845779 [Pavlovales sp. CCMP2436]|nr:hypothetical protein T492DRAFT_845779 [Pavlovales sp. CCMP2436]
MQFGLFLGRVARFGSRAILAIQKFGRQGGTFLNTAAKVASRVAKTARSGLTALEKSELGRIPWADELIGLGRDATNVLDVAARFAGRAGNFAAGVGQSKELRGLTIMESLPDFYRYEPRAIAPPVEMIRHNLTSTGEVPLFPVDRKVNSRSLVDFTTDLVSLRSSGTVQGIADFSPARVSSADQITNAYYSRAGATIPANSSLTVALPLMCPIGTLGMKAIALSQLQDSIRLEVKWASQLHLSEVRVDGAAERAMMDMLGGVVTMPTFDYSHFGSTYANTDPRLFGMQYFHNPSFKLGSVVVPQSLIDCTGSAAESRFELARTFGGGISDASARSCVSAAQYLTDGYAIGLSLYTFPQSDSLSDGISTQLMHVVFESKIAADNPALYIIVYVQHEKILIVQNGLLTYES